MAPRGCWWAYPLLWGAHEWPCAEHLSETSGLAMAPRAFETQPEEPCHLGPDTALDLTAGCHHRESVIPILSAVLASSPKAGAGCGKSARPDPWRGSRAIAIPTPTLSVGFWAWSPPGFNDRSSFA